MCANKIYTRKGDNGETSVAAGRRVAKDSPVIEVNGDLDELSCWLGMARALAAQSGNGQLCARLETLQQELFSIGTEVSLAAGEKGSSPAAVAPEQIHRMEEWIDAYFEKHPELKSFVLPGDTLLNAALHSARAVCRRAERRLISFSRERPVSEESRVYLNRLSDLLFAMALGSTPAAVA